MAQVTKILGMPQWLGKLKKHHATMGKAVGRALFKAGFYIQRMSQEIVPVETGNLKAGAFTRKEGEGFKRVVIVGYVADYALYVHENQDAAHGEAFNLKHADELAAGNRRDPKTGQYTGTSWYTVTRITPDGSVKEFRLQFKARGPDQTASFLSIPIIRDRLIIRKIVRDEVDTALDSL
jgi:hypothetical protein